MKSFLRKFTERATRGMVVRRSIQVGGRKVPLYVSPDAQLKYIKPAANAFDRDLITIAESFLIEDSCSWDVGANVGVFTFAAASISRRGTVVAIEADIWLANLLRRTSALQHYTNLDIRVIPTAVADEESILKFRIANRGRASNSLSIVDGSSQMGGTRQEQYVPSMRLDLLLKSVPNPNFVKIDVEGAELLVLEGAKKLIREIRPIFYIEISRRNRERALSIFRESNYSLFNSEGLKLHDMEGFNFFFVPSDDHEKLEKIDSFRSRLRMFAN